ncbi:EmrB/QacA subfamily drug resistance transporter [Bacillus mesophilus]|uniref:MFS transporter n=1 Tax=Bacillus mesophilus TaxID=1808955 RepID=A0A6M0Q8N8_9BACI|nr:MDR family MFS transporter [Bacillus mesophilus]MBM7661918.1 EmrB/QacA subfamily drug resistance transporter [Bacillus mesophilus]NEY72722.1 MFS transporter [Bacillus mesophilus]
MEHLDMKKKITIMVAVVSVLLFSALNMTIVGTALPKIVSSIGGLDYFDWVFTIYMLTSSITAILVGKLSDIYGRKIFLQVGIIIFSTGSLLSGFSEDIIQLIIYRGIQGFGGGMLMSISFATVGDLFSPRERGRWQGILGGTFGLASLLGPTLGGYIVDNFDWSWVFWVFLPFGVIAFILISRLYPVIKSTKKESVDYLGSLVLTITLVSLLLGFTWADSKYEWVSPQIIGLFGTSILGLVAFIIIESKVKSPVVPLFLFKNSVFTISNIVSFLIGIGMFSVIMYVPFFVQGVAGSSATTSGLVEMAMTIAMVVSSGTAGFLITKTGKYKIMAIVGLVIMAIGVYMNSQLTADSTLFNVIINLMVIGFGLGVTFPVFNLTVQNAVKHKYLGVATATSQLFRELGGTIGVAIMGSIMGRILTEQIQQAELPQPAKGTGGEIPPNIEQLQDPQLLMNPEALAEIKNKIPEQMHAFFEQFIQLMREALSVALSGVFLFSSVIIVVAVITTFFLKEIPLRTSNVDPEEEKEQETGTSS